MVRRERGLDPRMMIEEARGGASNAATSR